MSNIFRNRIFLRAIGIVLVCVSTFTALGWFFWLVPVIERFDPEWEAKFTKETYWKETQKKILRYGWMHDDFGVVGSYGDKSWAEWIMKRAAAGEEIGDCGKIGHKDGALKFITGNNPAGTNWIVEPYWLAWWSTNKDKSQVEWIQTGLQKYGASAHMPAATDDYESLLALLGNTSTNELQKVPNYIRYNAFRWLRDSGFNAVSFAISNVTRQTSEIIRNGLVKYTAYEKAYPKMDNIGLLEFTPVQFEREKPLRPELFNTNVQIFVYLLMILSFLTGTALIARSFRIPPVEAQDSGSTG